jgi:two-component system chemotaxis sensor kinase CheA
MSIAKEDPSSRVRLSLRSKLIRTMIGTLSVISAAVLATVATLHVWSAKNTLALVETKIRESITRKGQGLATDHAQALRGLVADNAFSDVRRLVSSTLREDPELVYGLFLGADGQPWAYVSPTNGDGAPSPSAVKELGIDLPSVMKAGVRKQNRHLFGQDVFEFSAPVVGDEKVVAGAIIYGVSGDPLDRALAKARNDSRRQLTITIVLFVSLAFTTTTFGVVVVRKVAARITQPISELTAATSAIAQGDRQRRVSIHSGDEVEALGHAFNQMVGELNESYARLEGMNHTLEQRVDERTRELGQRNGELRLVLDSVNEGLLSINGEGFLAPDRSAMIDRWFGPAAGRVRFVDYIGAVDRAFADSFELGYEALREDVLPVEVCLAQLPSRLRRGQREYQVSYLPLGEGGPLNGLLIVINDVTEQLALTQQEAEQRELLAAFQAFNRDRTGFMTFFDEANQIVEAVVSGEQDMAVQKRNVHTLKGNSSLMGLMALAQLCHRIEDEMEENRTVEVTPAVLTLRDRWHALSESLRALLGEGARDVVQMTVPELDRLCEELSHGLPIAKVVQRLATLRFEPVEKPLGRLAAHALALSQRLGKGDAIIDVEGHGLRLDPKRWGPLWSEMVHVVRNAVDHGFEMPEVRRAANKPAQPHLRLTAAVREHELFIEVEDDGNGIDWRAVQTSAAERGLVAETERDLMSALFAPGVSSRNKVTSTSGRGIGLAAVYSRVQELHGRVVVSSRPGAGTCWRFSFPLSSLGPHEGEGTGSEREQHVHSDTAVA